MSAKIIHLSEHMRDDNNPNFDLNQHLGFFTLAKMEGFCTPDQARWWQDFLRANKSVKSIAEIGFCGGHSSDAMLSARSDTEVVSFDLGTRRHVDKAKQYIDKEYPNRHTLIKGDSLVTVPQAVHRDGMKVDMLFIDGSHRFSNAYGDLANGREMVNDGGFVIMDDIIPHKPWGKGPTKAWDMSVASGVIAEIGREHMGSRSWAIGQYQ